MAEIDYNSIIQQGIDKVLNSRYRAGAAVGADMLGVGVKGLEAANKNITDVVNNTATQNNYTKRLGIEEGQLGINQAKQKLEEKKALGASGIMKSMLTKTGDPSKPAPASSVLDWNIYNNLGL